MKVTLQSVNGDGISLRIPRDTGKVLCDLIDSLRKHDADRKRTGILVYRFNDEWRIVPHPFTPDGLMELSCVEFVENDEIKRGVWIMPGMIHGNDVLIEE